MRASGRESTMKNGLKGAIVHGPGLSKIQWSRKGQRINWGEMHRALADNVGMCRHFLPGDPTAYVEVNSTSPLLKELREAEFTVENSAVPGDSLRAIERRLAGINSVISELVLL